MHDNNKIHSDLWLKRLMKTGIPLAVICLLSLWVGRGAGSGVLGWVFILTLPPVLVIGLAYNLRYLMLCQRNRGKSS